MGEAKRALVTGASEGIGREFAKQLAREGFELTLVSRNESRLKSLIQELAGAGHQIKLADLSRADGIDKIALELKSHRYHLLVNNAGKGLYGPFQKKSEGEVEEVMRLNCDALVKLSHAFLQLAKEGDALVNVGSVLSFLPLPFSAIYSASKAFVASFSQALWYEQKKRGVYVMSLCPGITESEFHTRAGGSPETKTTGWIVQTPEAVVRTALKALKKRKKLVVIPGSQNKVLTFASQFISRKGLATLLGHSRE